MRHACFFFAYLCISVATSWSRPNVLVVLIDDVGTGWIPPYAERLTPDDIEPEIVAAYQNNRGKVDLQKNIDAAVACMPTLSNLADEGVVFDRAFTTTALCGPSRAAVLTGMYHQRWGAYRNKDIDDHGIPLNYTLMAEPFAAAGYRTGIVGKWHVAPKSPKMRKKVWVEEMGQELPIPASLYSQFPKLAKKLQFSAWKTSSLEGYHPLDRGFDYYFGFNSYDDKDYESNTLWEQRERVPKRPKGEFLTDLLNQKSLEFIQTSLAAEKPFFLYYAPKTLHGAITAPPDDYLKQFNTGNQFTDIYASNMLALDDGLAKIMECLEASGEADNTLIIFTSDNGCTLYNVPPYNAPNRGGKGTGWNGGLNVPFIVWYPKAVKAGVNQELVSLTDIMPTVLDMSGLEIPSQVDGKSLWPYLTGNAAKGPHDTITSAGLHSSRWSYSYEAEGENNAQDAGKSPLYTWILDERFQLMMITPTRPGLYKALPDGYPGRTLLFDHRGDPQQRTNLVDRQVERVAVMSEHLRVWLDSMSEPMETQKEDYQQLLQNNP